MFSRASPPDLATISADRICVVKPSALGDVVQSLPLLPVLRQRFPGAEIAWVINQELADLLDGHRDIDRLIRFSRKGPFASWRRTLGELRAGAFDLVLDLQGLLRTGIMTALTRAPMRVGLETAREGSWLACHAVVSGTGRKVPAHERYWRVAEALGCGSLAPRTEVPIRAEDRDWAQAQFARLHEPVLAIHPGAKWKTKRWPVEKFAAIAAKATRHYGFATLILGSRDEQAVANQLAELLQRFVPSATVMSLAGQTTLKQLAAVLESADVLLTNDSGPMHLAAGLGTPVVGVFTCTSAVRSGPPGKQHELVSTELKCAASYRKCCPYRGRKHMACLEELGTERVWQGFVRLMDKRRLERRAA